MKRAVLILLGLLTSLALAVTYRVVDEGGPLTLSEDIAAAFAAWNDVEDGTIEAEVNPDAATVIRYGDSARFGPDTVSLTTLERQNDERTLSVLLSPNAGADQTTALLHETGVLLGLSVADRGVMNPLIGPAAPRTLTDADRSALQALQQFVPADLNRDGVVDFYDLTEFGSAFGQSGVNLPADINGDGNIDNADLAQLRDAYTFSPPSETPPSDAAAEPATDEGGSRLPVGEDAFPDLTNPDETGDLENRDALDREGQDDTSGENTETEGDQSPSNPGDDTGGSTENDGAEDGTGEADADDGGAGDGGADDGSTDDEDSDDAADDGSGSDD